MNSLQIQIKFDGEYVKYNEFHYKFRSNLNLPSVLKDKYAVNLHDITTFQFNSMMFPLANQKATILVYIYMHANSVLPSKTRLYQL